MTFSQENTSFDKVYCFPQTSGDQEGKGQVPTRAFFIWAILRGQRAQHAEGGALNVSLSAWALPATSDPALAPQPQCPLPPPSCLPSCHNAEQTHQNTTSPMSPWQKPQRAGQALAKQKILFFFPHTKQKVLLWAMRLYEENWMLSKKKKPEIFSIYLSKWQLWLDAHTWEITACGKDVVP